MCVNQPKSVVAFLLSKKSSSFNNTHTSSKQRKFSHNSEHVDTRGRHLQASLNSVSLNTKTHYNISWILEPSLSANPGELSTDLTCNITQAQTTA